MQLNELLNPEQTVGEAFTHPSLKVTKRTKKFPDMEAVKKAVIKTSELMVIRAMEADIEPIMQNTLDMYILMEGEHADAESKTDWESGLDDKIELAIEPYVDYLSNDWLGTNTIDATIHTENGIAKFAKSFGKEVWKQITNGKKPHEVIEDIGIDELTLEAALDERLALSGKDVKAMKAQEAEVEEVDIELHAVIGKIKTHIGPEHSIMDVYDDLDLASDDDDTLSTGAAARLGIDMQEVEVLRAERKQIGHSKAPEKFYDMIKDWEAPSDVEIQPAAEEAPKPAKKPAKKAAAKKPKPEVADEDEDGSEIDPEVFQTLKEFGGAKDAEMAKELGVSRQTYNNWQKGKGDRTLDGDQYACLREHFVDRINTLCEALGQLDGVDPHVID